MTYFELKKKRKDVFQAIIEDRLRDALDILDELKTYVSSSDIHNRFNSILDTYQNMLKYSFEMAPDPERAIIHNKLQQSLYELTDDIDDLWITGNNLFKRKAFLEQTRSIENEVASDSKSMIRNLTKSLSLDKLDKSDDIDSKQININQEKAKRVRALFYYYWLKNRYKNLEKELFEQIIANSEIDWSVKSLMVSALTLSQLRHFDREKIYLLFDLTSCEDFRIRQRAIIGIFLCLLVYQTRIPLYKDVMDRLKSIPDDLLLQERFSAVLIQFIRASDTEKITKKIQEEIVPEVMKIRSELEDKLNLKDLLEKQGFEDKNPEWENFFKDAPDVYQKLEQFSKMQIEGADVFMGAFANLKHFDFFKEMANWFIPFKGDNEVVSNAFEGIDEQIDIPEFVEGFEQSTVMCNSDKYSFCLNIQHMPVEQRKMMLELFNMELKAMNEMIEDEFKLNVESKNKIVNTQYLQDLYRFFKLYPDRSEFDDVFKYEADILQSAVFKIIYEDKKIIRNIAEFYFATDKYLEAVQLFNWLNNKGSSFELLEKMGFCYQQMTNYEQAIELYKQAELFDKDKLWLQKKLGYCYRKTGDIPKAIDYYSQILNAEPNDLGNLAYLGQLHIDNENYEEALKYYYRVEYEKPDNVKVYRPIGWCSFIQGKYDIAIKYFQKIINSKALKSDYLNIGHCYWAAGQMNKALESYKQSIRLSGNDEIWFRDAFQGDSKYLKKTGINDLDVALIIDYVLISNL